MLKLVMNPAPGERVLRFVGDNIRFALRSEAGGSLPRGWRAFLRTNLGRASMVRTEIIHAYTGRLPLAGASWRDIPLSAHADEWRLEMALHEVGYFKAKAYAIDPQGRQFWPEGSDVGIAIHPNVYRTSNTIYCAFARVFGNSRTAINARDEARETQFKTLDDKGYAVIPPSGKLRDLVQVLPHIIQTLGCRVVHLLPVNPTPAVYARFGRYGSPYASLDFTAIDPALVVFDRRTTGIDQFRELTYAAHSLGGRVFLDLAINHTGWGSTFQENHPEWFLRNPDGAFVSPGAWGNTWEDLCELAHKTPDLWDCLADAFLVWCQRGVDGFRCDAGYKVPIPAWQYIIARVRHEFPDTLFLLEGLGGAWEATESLLADGGMQWAYSELFQNYSGREVATYLDYSLRQSQRAGLWVHYSETHDNNRLAAKGRAWSLLRNRLCALTSVSGGFGFTCGVEWLATERINVHQCTGLSWDSANNLVGELRRLTQLLNNHPCFFDGSRLERLSPVDSFLYALRRDSDDGLDRVLVLVNTDTQTRQTFTVSAELYRELGEPAVDLLGQQPPNIHRMENGRVSFTLDPSASFCLAERHDPKGLNGDAYRCARAQAAWAITALSQTLPPEETALCPWKALSDYVNQAGPRRFLAALSELDPAQARTDLLAAMETAARRLAYPQVVVWTLADTRRVLPVPPAHWLLIQDDLPFTATLRFEGKPKVIHLSSVQINGAHVASFAPNLGTGDAALSLERFAPDNKHPVAQLRFLTQDPELLLLDPDKMSTLCAFERLEACPIWDPEALVLLTNRIGGMARMAVNLGRIQSKYDCLLAANLHPAYPTDRHVFAKRVRVWVNADGFLSPLDGQNLVGFIPGPPAKWCFVANAGDGRSVEIHLVADMLDYRNSVVLRFSRPQKAPRKGKNLSAHCDVRLTVRVDVEDRGFHGETRRNPDLDYHFAFHSRPLKQGVGFEFTPTADRCLRVIADDGFYHHEAEWCQNIPHPIEISRGHAGAGDAYSPGWFELPLPKGASVTVVASADAKAPSPADLQDFETIRLQANDLALSRSNLRIDDHFGRRLALSIQSFIARRASGKTVIAGYPWFLDWGRDSLICARGLLSAGMLEEVQQLLIVFGRFEENGTLPNSIHGADASNRDTSDAPLWYGIVCEETAAYGGADLYQMKVDQKGRTIADVLRDIAMGYAKGTLNGIRMDAASGLIWSPKHFTWMDTNFPSGTPREGYPVEIQVLWIRLLRQLGKLQSKQKIPGAQSMPPLGRFQSWLELAALAESSFQGLYWLEDRGYLADLLVAGPDVPAKSASQDNALRCNSLLAISLGLVEGERAQRCVDAALRYLVIPGALRSLAPLPVSPPLPIRAMDGRLLNNPAEPYWGAYEGDEDTRRKPAYHNGTAWTWTFPIFCEALAKAWNFSPHASAAAKAYLGSMARLMERGCLGQLPEITDGDAPHTQRGCDAQAWGATEALRVWKLLSYQP